MPLEVICPGCKKRYQVSDSLAGRSAKCKACGATIRISKPQPPAEANEDDDTARVAALFDDEFGSGPVQPKAGAQVPTKCPSCGENAAADAVLCVNCGYNFKTGAQTRVESEAPTTGPFVAGPLAARVPRRRSGPPWEREGGDIGSFFGTIKAFYFSPKQFFSGIPEVLA